MIELSSVSKRFSAGGPWVVRDVDLHVGRGEMLVLIGASGCGKTTTLRMINRLVEPTEGRVSVGGLDVRERPAEELRRGIGYVLQGVGLFPHWTVGENVGAVPRLLGWSPERIAARTRVLLEQVGLPPDEFVDREPTELSGGQRQRVGVARALAAEPSVMLMDEPFGALDPVTRDHLQTEVRELHERLGLTTVLVTHDMAEALLLADRIAVMDGGRIVRCDTPRALLADPGSEVVAGLMEAPRRHADLLERLS